VRSDPNFLLERTMGRGPERGGMREAGGFLWFNVWQRNIQLMTVISDILNTHADLILDTLPESGRQLWYISLSIIFHPNLGFRSVTVMLEPPG
jgi:hypothetical protein